MTLAVPQAVPDRQEAYDRKIAVIVDGLGALHDLHDLNRLEREGVLHVVQVAVDAAMDLIAMKVKDMGHAVSDDYHNLAALEEAGVLAAPLAEGLRRLNGLRNAIVHRYNSFEEQRVHDGIDEIKEHLLALTEAV